MTLLLLLRSTYIGAFVFFLLLLEYSANQPKLHQPLTHLKALSSDYTGPGWDIRLM